MDTELKDVLKVIIGVVAVTFVIMCGFTLLQKSLDTKQCYSFGNQADREVRFVTYNAVSWDCLTPSKDGKWISVEMLRDITE